MKKNSSYDLEERLLSYATSIIQLTDKLQGSRAGDYVGGQLLRSGISAYFNHGEAQGAESRKDFVHKLSVSLKELKESRRAIRLVIHAPLTRETSTARKLLDETEELIRIFYSSIRTAKEGYLKESPSEYQACTETSGDERWVLNVES